MDIRQYIDYVEYNNKITTDQVNYNLEIKWTLS